MTHFYVTTPIYYVNDAPHLGAAYTTIAADVLARYHRLRGDDVHFLTGTDEHGVKIERTARDKGKEVQAYVDEVSECYRQVWAPLSCTPDDFIRTTEERHIRVVQELWSACAANGYIYEGLYEGLYCVGCESFYTEKELLETPQGLTCPTHKTVIEKIKEPSFFFKLSSLQERLLNFYEKHPEFIAPESRRNEVISFVKAGLEDLSVSRTSFSWGIRVPNHTGDKQHVMYVWFDALSNYLSALGPQGDEKRRFWPPTVHLVGKDILRFHAVYWPAFLLAAGYDEEHLPKKVFAHGFLTINGQRMSKSLRNTVDPTKLSKEMGVDVVRYYLMREIAFGLDGDFSHVQMMARYNSELADSLGNLLNRTLGLCSKLRSASSNYTELNAQLAYSSLEEKLEQAAKQAHQTASRAFDDVAPHRAIDAIMAFCRAANKYVDEAAPWSEAKRGEQGNPRVDASLASCLETLRWLSVLLWPMMPNVSAQMRVQLGLEPIQSQAGSSNPNLWDLSWQHKWSTKNLQVGTPIFPKFDVDKQAQILQSLGVLLEEPVPAVESKDVKKPENKKESKAKGIPAPAAEISFDDFAKLDLRVGVIQSAERVPKSDKLLKLMVNVGDSEPRQVIAGIGKSFAPEDVIGKQVVVLTNLKPAKLMGLESRGMILAAGSDLGEGDLALFSPTKEHTPGMRIK